MLQAINEILKTMTVAENKLELFKELISIENENAIKQIHAFVRTFLPENEKKQAKVKPYISFEEWNEQFTDNQNLNEFIPEYGTTLKEFRKGIYEAELDEEGDMTFEELKESIKTW